MARLFPHFHYLTDEEKQHLQVGSDGKVHVSFNGIFTPPEEAAVYAEQHAENKNVPLYFVVFPQADSAISELLVAGYQKFMENNFWGLTNSTQKAKDLVYSHGITGLELYGHSRGTMTLGNMLYSFKQEGVNDVAGNTTINFFGPAYNTQNMADILYILSDGKQDYVNLENHKNDFVGTKIGKNPYTFEQIPPGSGPWKERGQIFKGYPSVHACYGHAGYACTSRYGLPNRTPIYSKYSGRKK
ncbi:filamentous hemagglutinin [Bartonella sp. MR110HLJHH]|uniref:filamentous hemagglutinin n=1 Tax=Bartonella sp. MR110HLJHH TaxID=3243555 RepID=UPI0035CFA432